MELTIQIDQILAWIGNAPGFISGGSSILALLVVAWLKIRNIDIGAKTTPSSLQEKTIESLMNQIQSLTETLQKTQEQVAILHDENNKLMLEIRTANQKITDLEQKLSKGGDE